MTELKPCPFCGDEVVVHHNKTDKEEWYSITHACPSNEEVMIVMSSDDKYNIISLWNRRA